MSNFEYVRETTRAVPSAVVLGRAFQTVVPPEEAEQEQTQPDLPEIPEIQDETNESEEIPMSEKPSGIEVSKDETWEDPEATPNENVLVARLAALLSVKSIITIALTVAFIVLVVNGQELPDQFVSIYTMCISFFFGYQFKKAEGGKDS